MKPFLAGLAVAIIVAIGAAYVLGTYQQQSDQAFQTSAVRLPDHGVIANLVGSDWSAPQ
jgi:hypothetical protein